MIYFAVGETEWVEDECEDLSATACPARWESSFIIRNLDTRHDYWPGESSFSFQLSALIVLALKWFKIRFVFLIWVPPSRAGDVCASSKKIVWIFVHGCISSNLVCSWLCFVALSSLCSWCLWMDCALTTWRHGALSSPFWTNSVSAKHIVLHPSFNTHVLWLKINVLDNTASETESFLKEWITWENKTVQLRNTTSTKCVFRINVVTVRFCKSRTLTLKRFKFSVVTTLCLRSG